MKKISFFVEAFPVLSQTFVIEQITNMIDAGFDVDIVALWPGEGLVTPPAWENHYKLRDKVTYLLSELPYSSRTRIPFSKKMLLMINIIIRPHLYWLLLECFGMAKRGNLDIAIRYMEFASLIRNLHTTDIYFAHFGNVGVYCSILRKLKVLGGEQMTVFHGIEMSAYDIFEIWKKQYIKLAESNVLLLPISELWKNKLVRLGIDKSKIEVIHMGINPNEWLFESRCLSRPLKVLTVARATEKKGLCYAINAVAMCDFDIEYEIVGDGPLLCELRELANALGVGKKIRFSGSQNSDYVKHALARADTFLLPSVTARNGDMEGIPVSLMEAMAKGVIVISTIHSGIPELIKDGVNGLLCVECDSKGLSEKLKALAIGTVNLEQMRINARKTIESQFNSILIVKQIQNALSRHSIGN